MDLYIRGLRINWNTVPQNSYLHDVASVRSISELSFSKNITFFVGENGSGKSTLLEAIAVAYGFNSEGGTINYKFSTFDDVSPLSESMTLIKGHERPLLGYFFRAETFFNVVSFGASEYMGRNYHEVSHGESFLEFMQSFDTRGLYIIDEPEAALSPQKQLSLLRFLYLSSKNGSQFIIATHSSILLGCPEASILSFDDGELKECAYEDTNSYQITKNFLLRKDILLEQLLSDE